MTSKEEKTTSSAREEYLKAKNYTSPEYAAYFSKEAFAARAEEAARVEEEGWGVSSPAGRAAAAAFQAARIEYINDIRTAKKIVRQYGGEEVILNILKLARGFNSKDD